MRPGTADWCLPGPTTVNYRSRADSRPARRSIWSPYRWPARAGRYAVRVPCRRARWPGGPGGRSRAGTSCPDVAAACPQMWRRTAKEPRRRAGSAWPVRRPVPRRAGQDSPDLRIAEGGVLSRVRRKAGRGPAAAHANADGDATAQNRRRRSKRCRAPDRPPDVRRQLPADERVPARGQCRRRLRDPLPEDGSGNAPVNRQRLVDAPRAAP